MDSERYTCKNSRQKPWLVGLTKITRIFFMFSGDVLTEILADVYNKEKLLMANGCLWDTCQKVQALPRDLIQLCLLRCHAEYESLVDAEEELKNVRTFMKCRI